MLVRVSGVSCLLNGIPLIHAGHLVFRWLTRCQVPQGQGVDGPNSAFTLGFTAFLLRSSLMSPLTVRGLLEPHDSAQHICQQAGKKASRPVVDGLQNKA